ncbi:MAG TPA: efflux RND transporter periplasmic adaptor subunit [Terriglobales bacterium]|nr:efflux RND transporter periplasmic adaptor subunit [Terriglobales bacterium]
MNKPVAVGSLVVIALGAFIAGRFTVGSSSKNQPTAKRILYYVDPMHPAYKSDKPGTAPDCGMALEPVYGGDNPASKLQLPAGAVSITPEQQQLIGVRVEKVEKNTGTRLIRTTGRVAPDDNRVFRLMAGTDGWIRELQDTPAGTAVKKDQLLATFYSREFRNAEQAYLGSLASIDRVKSTRDAEDINRLSDSSVRINEEQLRTLGMGEPQIRELAKTRLVTGDIALVAPVDGIVLSRTITPQQSFEKGTEFFRIADLSKVWIVADVFSDETATLRPGSKATVMVRELGKTVSASVSNSPPLFDAASRTLKLRLETDNPGMFLRPDMYVDVEFHAPAPVGISVPAESILDSGMQKIVYLETSDGVFEPRPVELGGSFGNRVTVKRGLAEGDRVVTSGNFLIDSESRMKPAALRAVDEKRDVSGRAASMARASQASTSDPVCGMSIDREKSLAKGLKETYRGETYVFCSDKCHNQFLQDPAKYIDDRLRSATDSGSGRAND